MLLRMFYEHLNSHRAASSAVPPMTSLEMGSVCVCVSASYFMFCCPWLAGINCVSSRFPIVIKQAYIYKKKSNSTLYCGCVLYALHRGHIADIPYYWTRVVFTGAYINTAQVNGSKYSIVYTQTSRTYTER